MTCREAEPLLEARLDHELDIAGSATIDRHIAECRACSAQYTALQNLHQEIAEAGLAYVPEPTLERKLASRFLPKRESAFSFWKRPGRSVFVLAGAAACLALLMVAVPRMGNRGENTGIDTEILDNHLRALQPNHLLDVPSSDQHTVKPWFQGKTSFSPPVRDLTNDGFVLVGGRLDVIQQQPTAAIVYRRRQHVISFYVMPSPDGNEQMTSHDVGGYHLLHWVQNDLSYWAVSDVNATELRVFADLVAGK